MPDQANRDPLPPIYQQFVGTWKLVNYRVQDTDGNSLKTLGENPIGVFMVDENGYSNAQIMADGRPDSGAAPLTRESMAAAFATYVAYYGKINVDETNSLLTTHVETALNPTWVGSEQKRYYAFNDDQLISRPPPMTVRGIDAQAEFIWEKAC